MENKSRVHPVKSSEAGISPKAKLFNRVHIIVSGSVHGVTFRVNTLERARVLGLTGWVKNISEGVEAVIEGDQDQVKQISEWMKHGPSSADVYGIDITKELYKGEFKNFKVKYF